MFWVVVVVVVAVVVVVVVVRFPLYLFPLAGYDGLELEIQLTLDDDVQLLEEAGELGELLGSDHPRVWFRG